MNVFEDHSKNLNLEDTEEDDFNLEEINTTDKLILNKMFTVAEIKTTVQMLKNSKASGME